ncbi:MAG: M48 family metalloprotease [Candidatus Omnitrophica bacterium]|nr:M48 family metalloprotease [Candidatus Omnitrophota bacterium]
MLKIRLIHILVFIALLPFLMGFFRKTFNVATKKDDLILISTEREKNIGAAVAKQVEKQFKDVDDPLIQLRVENIGEKLSVSCERKDLIYRFKVLKAEKEDNYNAFALPGGYVYIFDALVNKLNNDDEIAAILAHELGHITAKHSIKRMQSAMGMNALMLLGAGMQTDGRTFAKMSDALTELMMSYSREAEIEADVISVRYIKNAGYNSEAVIEVLKMLKKLRKKGPVRRYMHYRTHPYLSERLARTRTEIDGEMSFDSFINLPKEKEDF